MKRVLSVAPARHFFALTGLAFAASVGSLSAADHYYVNDHLATTTAVTDAAGEIAAIEADAFGTPLAGAAQAARFTGKPYDDDIGAFVFPFRNYRSDEARWMSADPSGFPDGVNASRYAPSPLSGLDSLGLAASKVTGSSFTAGAANGGLSFNITTAGTSALAKIGDSISSSTGYGNFSMSSTSGGNGWIIQQVDFNYNYKEWEGGDTKTFTKTYYEAWSALIVNNNYNYMFNGNDTFRTRNFAGYFSGSATITGSAFFVSSAATGSNDPDNWPTNENPQAPNQGSTPDRPSWLPSGSGTTHTLNLSWSE